MLATLDGAWLWNPVLMRRQSQYCSETRVIKKIKKGEPLLEDYNGFDFEDGSLHKKELTDGWCAKK